MTQKSVQGLISWLRSWFDEYYEDKSNKVSSWSSTTNNTRYPSEKLVKDSLDLKSDFGHGHTIEDITTPMYSSSQIDTLLQNITGDTATDVMDKIGMLYDLRNETVHNITGQIQSYWQGIMEYGLSAILQDYLIDGAEGVYEISNYGNIPTDLFYYYDGNNLTCLTQTKIELSCSDYNPNIDSTVVVTAKLTDMFGNPVPYENLTLEIQSEGGSSSVNLITDSNGVATYNYTCSSWGVCRFSIKTYVSYINVGNPYPVGSIYMSVTNTNPATLFGGTWVQLENRFLLGAGSDYTNGSTGGSKDAVVVKHNHTQNSHNHTQNAHNHSPSANSFLQTNVDLAINGTARTVPSTGGNAHYVYVHHDNYSSSKTITYSGTTANRTATNQAATATNQETGENGTNKNMPPYLVVYMWKRTA